MSRPPVRFAPPKPNALGRRGILRKKNERAENFPLSVPAAPPLAPLLLLTNKGYIALLRPNSNQCRCSVR
eukprot:scaffold459_cov117-Isochrysis_galbana.AAC.21